MNELLRVTEETLISLDSRFRLPLLSMYRGEPQRGIDGLKHPIDQVTKISASQGIWLYQLCETVKPQATLEIGMAYGYSTLFFLAAMAKSSYGHHISIDPYQSSYWSGIGLSHTHSLAHALGTNAGFQLIEDRSDRAATDLARSNSKFDVIFIDGNHRFDDVLVDFYLYAPLCTVGGYIIFDDMWMSSIQTVVAYLRANRTDFTVVDTSEPNICVFQKISEDTRRWTNFKKFPVSADSD